MKTNKRKLTKEINDEMLKFFLKTSIKRKKQTRLLSCEIEKGSKNGKQ